MTPPNYSSSPAWSPSSKRLVLVILSALVFLALYRIRGLLLPLIMAVLLAYLVEPVVKLITRLTRLPRTLVIGLVYLTTIAVLTYIPVSAIPPIVTQANNLLNNTPQYLQQLGEFLREPLIISEGIEIPINELSLDQAYATLSDNLINVIQTIGSQTLSLFGSVASATLSTVGWTIVVLFLSFYMVKDHEHLFHSLVEMAPAAYQGDLYLLGQEMSATWNAFLRGQLVLGTVVGFIIFLIALVIGLPNALILALIAGFAEFLPTIGPVLAAIPAALVAFFQSEASWIGNAMSPFWFTVVVIGVYAIIFHLESYFLAPRIIGHHLRLHPLVVILGALAGASIAGFLGVLLAAPVLASAKLIFMYVYCKLTDQPPFPNIVVAPADPEMAVAGEPEVMTEPASATQNFTHELPLERET